MSIVRTWQIESGSSEATEKLAEKLGRVLRGGEVIELVSDLGGGKTTFVRGMVRGMGSTDKVASPTFTLSKMYRAGKHEIHHFDFYRLDEPGIMAEELNEVIEDPNAIAVVEWANVVRRVLPEKRLTIRISQTQDGDRSIEFHCPESLHYIEEALSD